MKYRIEIGGRGGEIAIGKVKREFYDAVQDNELDIDDYAWNWDFFEENDIFLFVLTAKPKPKCYHSCCLSPMNIKPHLK